MSSLTSEELQNLTDAINSRLAEFGDIFQSLTPGLARLMYDVTLGWLAERGAYARVFVAETMSSGPHANTPQLPTDMPNLSSRAASDGQRLLNGNTPTHGPGRRKRTNGHLTPTVVELIDVLRRLAKDGMMPTMAEFNEARPARWSTASAHVMRLGTSWDELAQEAGLMRRRSGLIPGSTPSEENNLIGDFH